MIVSDLEFHNHKMSQKVDHNNRFVTIGFFEIRCIMDIYKNDLNIYLRESDIPQELIYCFKELNDVIVTTANDFKTKFNDKKSKYFFDNYRSTQYLIFDKKEWEMSDKFIDKVRLQLKEIFDRYYRDAKYVYINRIKAETLEETSLYLKDK